MVYCFAGRDGAAVCACAVAADESSSAAAKKRRIVFIGMLRFLHILSPPLGPPLQAGDDDALQQLFVGHAGALGGFGEILAVAELRVGVGLDDERLAVGVHAQVDAG